MKQIPFSVFFLSLEQYVSLEPTMTIKSVIGVQHNHFCCFMSGIN